MGVILADILCVTWDGVRSSEETPAVNERWGEQRKKSQPTTNNELLKHTTKHRPKRPVSTQSVLSSQGSERSQQPKFQAQKSQVAKPQAQKPQTQNNQQGSKSQASSQRPAQQNVRNNQGRPPQWSQSSQKPRPTQNSKPAPNRWTKNPNSRYTSKDDAFYS